MHYFVLVLMLSSTLLTDDALEPPRVTETGHVADSLEVVKRRLEQNQAVLIDVREIYEWNDGHLKQAKFVPLSAIRKETLTDKMEKALTKGKPIYCHCASGFRVLKASEILREQGYDIRPLKTGYEELVKAGFAKAVLKKKKTKREEKPQG